MYKYKKISIKDKIKRRQEMINTETYTFKNQTLKDCLFHFKKKFAKVETKKKNFYEIKWNTIQIYNFTE